MLSWISRNLYLWACPVRFPPPVGLGLGRGREGGSVLHLAFGHLGGFWGGAFGAAGAASPPRNGFFFNFDPFRKGFQLQSLSHATLLQPLSGLSKEHLERQASFPTSLPPFFLFCSPFRINFKKEKSPIAAFHLGLPGLSQEEPQMPRALRGDAPPQKRRVDTSRSGRCSSAPMLGWCLCITLSRCARLRWRRSSSLSPACLRTQSASMGRLGPTNRLCTPPWGGRTSCKETNENVPYIVHSNVEYIFYYRYSTDSSTYGALSFV